MITKLRANMTQLDFFDETLQKKILRLEKWIYRLQKEMMFLKETYQMRQRDKGIKAEKIEFQQDMFVG